eukprot:TRINITY_DN3284_c0_g1_i3.p1 TRINITY_DN3284_c0_g1~~TRINITY_DN3284_c0_g1_i3.p1  ORF type:complete len:3093 (+),score=888.87 TRINITY_DN3284_c0_g1_i3:80-9358(+)
MILESIASTLLARYLGEYVEGFQKEHLQVSLLSGDVVLENLQLKREALDRFDLPIKVKAGHLGKLSLNVPWKNFKSKPASVTIERLYLVAGPKANSEFDPQMHEKNQLNQKKRKLDEAESLAMVEDDPDPKADSGGWMNPSIVTRLVDNIQIEIKSLHIRYEDDLTDPKNPFVCGITLESISGFSTDRFWNQKFVEDVTIIHKLISLRNLSVYWDTKEPFLKFKNSQELGELLKKLIPTDQEKPSHTYVMKPVSGELKLILNKNNANLDVPQIQADFSFPEIGLAFEQQQYRNFTDLIQTFSLYSKGIKYRSIRPKVSIKSNPRAWLQFAVHAILTDIRQDKRRMSWDAITTRKRHQKEYINIHRKIRTKKLVTNNEQELYDNIEKILPLETLIFFRTLAQASIKKDQEHMKKQLASQPVPQPTGFFSKMFTKTIQENPLAELNLSEGDLQKLISEVDYEHRPTVVTSHVPKEYVKRRIGFVMKSGIVEMNDGTNPISKANFMELKIGVSLREESTLFELTLDAISVLDQFTKKTRFPLLVNPLTSPGQKTEFLQLKYERNPLDQPGLDHFVGLEMKSVDIVLNRPFIDRISSFFSQANPVALQDMEIVLAERLEKIKKQTREQLLLALQEKKSVDLRVKIKAPTIIIPEDCVSASTEVIILDLGNLEMRSDESNRKKRDLNTSANEDFYDKFAIKMTELNAMIASSTENWRSPTIQKELQLHLLEHFNIDITLKKRKIEDESLTKIILDGSLPSLNFRFSSERIRTIISTIDKIMNPQTPISSTPSTPIKSSPSFLSPSSKRDSMSRSMNFTKADLSSLAFSKSMADLRSSLSSNLVSPKVQSAPNTPRVDKNSLVTSKFIEIQFSVSQASIQIFQTVNKYESKPIITLNVAEANFEFTKRTFDLSFKIGLQQVVVDDHYQTHGEQFKYLASSLGSLENHYGNVKVQQSLEKKNKEEALAFVEYKRWQKNSPEYKNLDQSLSMKFNTLGIMFNRETIVLLIETLTSITSSTPSVASPSVQREKEKEDTEIDEKELLESKDEQVFTKFQIDAEMNSLSLTLNKDGEKIAHFSLSESSLEMSMRSNDTMIVHTMIGTATMIDLKPQCEEYDHIIRIKGKRMADITYETFPKRDNPGYDMKLDAKIESIRFIYLQRLISELGSYFTKIATMRRVLKQATEKASQKTKEVVENLSESKSLFKFDVSMTNPHVIVPNGSKSTQILVLDLGQINLNNQFETLPNGVLMEKMSFDIKSANAAASRFEKEVELDLSQKILNDVDLKILLDRISLSPSEQSELADTKITMDMSKFGLVLSEKQMVLLAGIYVNNISSKSDTNQRKEAERSNSTLSPQSRAIKSKSDAEKTKFHLDGKVAQIFLEFITNEGSPVVGFYMNHLNGQVKQFHNDKLTVDVSTVSIVVKDNRKETENIFKEILSSSDDRTQERKKEENSEETKELVVNYSRDVIANIQTIDLAFDYPRFILVPEAVSQIRGSLIPAFSKMGQVFSQKEEDLDPPPSKTPKIESIKDSPSTANSPKSMGARRATMVISARVTNPEIVLIEDMKNLKTRALVAKTTIDFNYESKTSFSSQENSTKFKWSAKNLEVLRCILVEQETSSRSILEPFDISGSHETTPKEASIDIDVQPVRIICSYKDIRFISAIYNYSMQSFKSIESKDEDENKKMVLINDSPKEVQNTATSKLFFIQKESKNSLARSQSYRKGQPVSPPQKQKNQTVVEHLKLSAVGIRVTLINDCKDVRAPIADIHLSTISADLTGWSSQLGLFVKTKSNASYFNEQISGWEPLIEPWNFVFKVNRKILADSTPKTTLSFMSSEKLNFNLTGPFLETMLKTHKSWTSDDEGSDDQHYIVDLNPYYVRNETGQKVWFWLPGQDVKELNTGCEAILDIKRDSKEKREGMTAESAYTGSVLSFQIEGDYKPLLNVPIDKIGSTILGLRSADETQSERKVVYDVRFRATSKVVTFRSRILLQNQTKVPVEVEFINDTRTKQQAFEPITIEPQAYAPIPVDFSDEGQFGFRPKGFGYAWSAAVSLKHFSKKGSAECAGRDDASFRFTLTELLTREDLSFRNQLVYQINTPITLFNHLPVEANFKMLGENSSLLMQGKIEKFEEYPIHQIRVNQQIGFSIQCQGFQWSSVASLRDKFTSLDLVDNKGKSMKIVVENRMLNNTRTITVFAKYWMINTTGLRLLYSHNQGRSTCAGSAKFEDFQKINWSNLGNKLQDTYIKEFDRRDEPFMFDFPRYDPFFNNCSVKIADSEWSKGFSLDTSGTVNYLDIPDIKRSKDSPTRLYQIGVQVSKNKMSSLERTNAITFVPRYLLVNRMKCRLYIRQQGTTSKEQLFLDEGEIFPFYWPDASKPQLLSISVKEKFSGSFSIDTVSSFALKIKEEDGTVIFPQIQIKLDTDGSQMVIFSEDDPLHPPYRIDNETDHVMSIKQKGSNSTPDKIPSGYSLHYAWDDFTKPHILSVWLDQSSKSSDFKLDKIKKFASTDFRDIRVESFADGPTRVLKLMTQTGKGDRPSLDQREEEEIIRKEFIISLSGIGISIIDSTPSELLYITIDKIDVDYTDSDIFQKYEGKVGSMQIDNQILWTPFPVALSKAPSAKDKNFIQFSAIKSNRYTRVNFFNYFSVLFQEMNVCLEEEFVVRVMGFFRKSLKIVKTQVEEKIEGTDRKVLLQKDDSKMVYFQVLHLHPILANVSFMSLPGVEEKFGTNLSRETGIPSRLLANVDHAPLELNGLLLENPFDTQSDLVAKIITHYTVQGITQGYKIMGALDVFGSPINLFNNIGTGFYDFFHEPAKGIIKSPSDFGMGIAKGTSSLAKNVVFGIFNTTTKITGSIGTGLSALSMDNDYMRERQARSMRDRPQHIGEGVMLGARDFGLGFIKGLTGIVEEPMKGVEKEGVGGFFKGLGRGLVGTVVKPTVGVIDLATQTTKGLRNTASMFDAKITRNRPPRYFGPEKMLEVYSREKAVGVSILFEISGGNLRDEIYTFHIRINHPKWGKIILLVTNKRVLLRKNEDLSKIWEERLSDVRNHLETSSTGVTLRTLDGRSVTVPCVTREEAEQVYWALISALEGEANRRSQIASP